jgi:hypothetical protein
MAWTELTRGVSQKKKKIPPPANFTPLKQDRFATTQRDHCAAQQNQVMNYTPVRIDHATIGRCNCCCTDHANVVILAKTAGLVTGVPLLVQLLHPPRHRRHLQQKRAFFGHIFERRKSRIPSLLKVLDPPTQGRDFPGLID